MGKHSVPQSGSRDQVLMAFAIALLAFGSASAGATPSAAGAASGPARLPDFSLPDLDGKVWTRAQFIGRPVLMDFWATWCNTRKETIPKLAALHDKNKGLTVVGVSEDKGSGEKIRKAAKRLGINYLVLLDPENKLGDGFGFKGIPSLYLFDRKGELKSAMPGYDPSQESQLDAAADLAMR